MQNEKQKKFTVSELAQALARAVAPDFEKKSDGSKTLGAVEIGGRRFRCSVSAYTPKSSSGGVKESDEANERLNSILT